MGLEYFLSEMLKASSLLTILTKLDPSPKGRPVKLALTEITVFSWP